MIKNSGQYFAVNESERRQPRKILEEKHVNFELWNFSANVKVSLDTSMNDNAVNCAKFKGILISFVWQNFIVTIALKQSLRYVTSPMSKAYLHVSLILHQACRFTTQTKYFHTLKWTSLFRNHSLKSAV